MDQVVKYNVYDGDDLVASFNAQAPATSYAKRASLYGYNEDLVLEVVEEVFAHVSSRKVRSVVNGEATKCT